MGVSNLFSEELELILEPSLYHQLQKDNLEIVKTKENKLNCINIMIINNIGKWE